MQVKKEPYMEIRAIAKYLQNNKIKTVYTGHCTGEKAYERLEASVPCKKKCFREILSKYSMEKYEEAHRRNGRRNVL